MADGCALDRLADWLGNKPEAAARAMNSGVDISYGTMFSLSWKLLLIKG